MKLALAQLAVVPEDRRQTTTLLLELLQAAAQQGTDLVVFPELCTTEYFCVHWDYRYLSYAESCHGATVTAVTDAVRRLSINVILPIYLEDGPGMNYDAALLINRAGRIAGVYRKTHPAARQSLEKIYFKPGSRLGVFQVDDWCVGILICYDTYFPEAARIIALRGAELLVLPFAAHRVPMWTAVLPTRAYENGVYVAAVNRVGREPGPAWNTFMGRSLVADPFGTIVIEADDTAGLVFAKIDRAAAHARRAELANLRRRPDLYEALSLYEEDARALP
jgi:N-carbamoylputrescine amidase